MRKTRDRKCLCRPVRLPFTDPRPEMNTNTLRLVPGQRRWTTGEVCNFFADGFAQIYNSRQDYKKIEAVFAIGESTQRRLPRSLHDVLNAYTSWFNRMDAYPFRAGWKGVIKQDAILSFPKLAKDLERYSENADFIILMYTPKVSDAQSSSTTIQSPELELELEEPPVLGFSDLGK